MTTVEKEHGFRMFCQGKSNKRIYSEICSQRGIKRNSDLAVTLCDQSDSFEMKNLELAGNYLGSEGVEALLSVIQANKSLEHVGISHQGIDDTCLLDVLEVIRCHPRITSLDVSGNCEVSNAVSNELISVLRDNVMLCHIDLEGCSIAKAVQRKIYEIAERNRTLEAEFFQGDYLKMKKIFIQLDTDLSGMITMSELLTNIEIPQVAATLVEKFKYMDGEEGKRDQSISINEFLNFVYPHYKTTNQIRAYSKKDNDMENTIAANHTTLAACIKTEKVVAPHYNLIRVNDRELSTFEFTHMINRALEVQSTLEAAGPAHEGGRIILSLKALKAGLASVYTAPQRTHDQKRKEFNLPTPIIKQIMRVFDSRQPPSFSSLFSATYETALIKLKPSILIPIVQQHGVTLSTLLSVQEAVTLFEEYHELITFQKSV